MNTRTRIMTSMFVLMASIGLSMGQVKAESSGLITLVDIQLNEMADYKKLIPIIKKWEGGFSNNPNDKGGATNSGVTLSTFRYYYGKNKTAADLKKMTDEQWEHIFKDGYWNRWSADSIQSQSIANIVVDWLWASGVYGIKYVQKILGVADDGVVGNITITAINTYPNQKDLFGKIWARRKKHFDDIVKKNPKQKVFLNGWYNRLNSFRWNG